MGDEGFLTLTVRVRVRPEPGVLNLLRRYRDALNYAVEWIVKHSVRMGKKYRVPSLSIIHRNLYVALRSNFGLPSRVAIDCYREALAIAKSYLGNGANGRLPRVRTLRMWLTPKQSYRVRDGYVEIVGGCRLHIIGWDRRYDGYECREARLVYREDGRMYLMITKRVPKPEPLSVCRGVLAVDINEGFIYVGNSSFIMKFETPVRKAVHFRRLAEELQRRYSFGKYRAWTRKGVLRRIKYFHRRAKNIIEDWARKVALAIVLMAKRRGYAVAREDLRMLVKSLRKLPKEHRVRMLILAYRRLTYWIDWQAAKHGVKVVTVDPRGTSSTCPKCGGKLVRSSYRIMRCPKCGLQADRDVIAVLNIEKKAQTQMGGPI